MEKIREKLNEIVALLVGTIMLGGPLIFSMIMSKVNIIKIILIELIIYIMACFIRKIINKKIKIEPTFKEKYYRDIPQIKPALLLYYLNKDNHYYTKNDFYATILDLINRNFFILNKNTERSGYKIKVNKEKDLDELNRFEKSIIELLFSNFNITEVEFSDLKKHIEEDKLFQGRVEAWKMLVELEALKSQYSIKNKKVIALKKISAILSIASAAASYFLLVFKGNVSEIVYILIIGILIMSIKIYDIEVTHFSQRVIDEIEKGKALKRYLEDYSLIDEKQFEQIKIWEGFLVYATLFDTAPKVEEYFDNIFK